MFGLTEFFPLLCGVALGLVIAAIRSSRLRRATWIALSVLGGLAANLLSGEEWPLLLFDASLIALCAQAVVLLRKLERNAQAS